MGSIKTTYWLIALSVIFIVILMSETYPTNNALSDAVIKVGALWIVALIVLPIQWLYEKIFDGKGSYLKQYNYMLSCIFLLVFISWF